MIDKIDELTADYESMRYCRLCESLCKTRTNIVYGCGSTSADLLIVGEAPSEEDDFLDTPLSGSAGSLVNDAMESVGIRRGDTYVTNLVLCRPANEVEKSSGKVVLVNRSPTSVEKKNCRSRLEEEIYIINPKLIIFLGSAAAKTVTARSLSAAIKEQPYTLKIPGRQQNSSAEYLSLITRHPGNLLKGDMEKRPGSPFDEFTRCFKTASNILKALSAHGGQND